MSSSAKKRTLLFKILLVAGHGLRSTVTVTHSTSSGFHRANTTALNCSSPCFILLLCLPTLLFQGWIPAGTGVEAEPLCLQLGEIFGHSLPDTWHVQLLLPSGFDPKGVKYMWAVL